MRRPCAGLTLALAGLLIGGCYGPFNLTRRVYQWNGEVGDKWEKELVFLLLTWVPVYSLSVMADAIIFNSMEFWTGNNPVDPPVKKSALPHTKRLARGAHEARLVREDTPSYQALTVELLEDGQRRQLVRFEHRPGAPTVARDARGEIILAARTRDDGGILIHDRRGRLVAAYSADQVQRFAGP
jgi:hypothetical protein